MAMLSRKESNVRQLSISYQVFEHLQGQLLLVAEMKSTLDELYTFDESLVQWQLDIEYIGYFLLLDIILKIKFNNYNTII